MSKQTSIFLLVGLGLVAFGGAVGACGSDLHSTFVDTKDSGPGGGGGDGGPGFVDGDGGPGFGPGSEGGLRVPASLTIDPPTATIDLTTAPFPTKAFVVTAHYDDGSTGTVTTAWSVNNAAVGAIDGTGLYTPRGTQGGVVTVTASAGVLSVTATLTVKLHQVGNAANADAATQAALLGATTADGSIVWTYPYDGMAYARGLNAPEMMWNHNVAGDVYAVHIDSPTYELTSFTAGSAVTPTAGPAPLGPRSFAFDPAEWATFVSSTSGNANVTVTRKSGPNYTKVVDQTWKIASRSMSGTIYYWAINKAAVVRIKPGAQQPDFFLSSATVPAPGEKNDQGVTTTTMYCPSCHTVSSDGSTLAMGTGAWGQAGALDVWSTVYDLTSSTTTFFGYQSANPPTEYPLAGLTPDGKVLVENWASVRGAGMGKHDVPVDLSAPSGNTGTFLQDTALDTLVGAGTHTLFPTFSADNALFAYVDSQTAELFALTWDPVAKTFSNKVKMAAKPASVGGVEQKISYPAISPDHRWIVYQVGRDYGSLDTRYLGDLYAVDTTNPQNPISLDSINQTMSAAADATRDQHRSYEPTFAPVASGGYFWLVFHSRRTYGNRLVDVPYIDNADPTQFGKGTEGSGTKQLWVAAIDVPGAGSVVGDPSHAPFWLPGQDITTRNMRGYWALDPCHADGATCTTGTDCCNGFCDATNGSGDPVCGKTVAGGCSAPGDRCNVSSDCCNESSGVQCINHACAEPPPR